VRVEDDETSENQERALETAFRFARGTGEHPPLVLARDADDDIDCLVHDLRGPLAAIGHELELVERHVHPAAHRSIGAIRSNVSYLERLLQDLLATARPARSVERTTNLTALVEEIVSRLPEPHQERVYIDARARVAVMADPTRIERVIANLLDNAIKYTEGTIVIRTERVDEVARVSVTDTGAGMTPELAARVFDRHVRSDGGGAGLGLYLARKIIESYGGRIGVDTRSGKGSRFYFELGTATKPASVARDADSHALAVSSILCGASVLLVDDDVRQLRALAEILRSEHVTVVTATSAPECLIRVAAQRPEVIVLDLNVRGTDVLSLWRSLSMIEPRKPIILTTGLPPDHPVVVRALEVTNAWFLAKPFKVSELFVVLEQALITPRRS